MCCDQSRICPIAWRCLYEPESYGYYIHESHAVCSFASSPHSTEHSNHEAYKPHICVQPSQKPAQRNSFMLSVTIPRFRHIRCECYIKTQWNDFTVRKLKKLNVPTYKINTTLKLVQGGIPCTYFITPCILQQKRNSIDNDQKPKVIVVDGLVRSTLVRLGWHRDRISVA